MGRCSVNMTIGLITKKVNLFIIKNSHHNLIIGLDLFKPFSLSLTENLKIFQKIHFNDDIFIEEIHSNYTNPLRKNAQSNNEPQNGSNYNSTKQIASKINKININTVSSNSNEKFSNSKINHSNINKSKFIYNFKDNTNDKVIYNSNNTHNSNDECIGNANSYKQNINNESFESLSELQKEKLNTLLTKYIDIFSRDKYDIGSISIEQCKIELTNNVPINLRPYRCSLSDQKLINDQIKMLLEKNLIRKSVSPYSFPVTLVDKKDEGKKTRLCIDFRKLNQVSIADNFPFPRLQDIIDKLYDSKYFTTLDISSGFWHVKVAPKDIQKFAFVTMNDHYEWLVMPFGYRNSPAIFQRVIYSILKKHNLANFTHNYIDDILIHSNNFEEHVKHIELVLKALKSENVKLKLSKCKFANLEVNYLGHKLSLNKVIPLNSNIEAITKFPIPNSVKQIQQFLGKVNYYHKFIPSAAKLLHPLYELLKKDKKFVWDNKCQHAFDEVKRYLTTEPILAIFNPNEESFVYCDASKKGLGAVLKQKQADNLMKPIAYFSKKLLKYQENYDITELECLCIVEAIDFWHHYLYGTKFTVITDHNALKYLKTFKKHKSRCFKWSLSLSQYNFDIKYQAGKLNQEADALSRNPVMINFENSNHIKIVNLIEKKDILEAQNEYKDIPSKCIKENDLIVRIKNNLHKVFVPEKLRKQLIENFHLTFGHIGKQKVLNLISSCYYWPQMGNDINEFVSACQICQTNKVLKMKKLGSLSQIGPAKNPFDIISIDTIGGLSGYNSSKQYIHLAIDNFTRFIWTVTSKTQTSKDFINLIKNIMQISKPKLIIADQYTGINSKEFLNFLTKNDIKYLFITVNCPQSNGLCERANQTIVTRLRCMFNDSNQKTNWPKLLNTVVQQYNDTPHDVTKFSPNHLLFNKKPYESLFENESCLPLERIREIAFQNSQKHHEINKHYYDLKHKQVTFKEGDQVLIENKNYITRKKLDPVMIGPFEIIKKLSDISYVIQYNKKGKTDDIFHVSKLRPYNALS